MIDAAKLAASLRSNPSVAARDLVTQIGSGGAVIEERHPLYYGYKSSQYHDIGNGQIAAGAPINKTSFDPLPFDRFIPQIVVGTVPDNVISGAETGALSPSVITLTGTDLFGNALVRTINVSAKGAYSLDRAYATYVSLVSDVDVGAPVSLLTGKGIGLANAFDEASIVVAVADLSGHFPADDIPSLHGPTGTVIPSAVYNAGEIELIARYVAVLP